MKKRLAFLLLFPALLFGANKSATHCGCACCKDKAVCCCNEESAPPESTAAETDKPTDTAVARHPLRGVIVAVRAEQSALLVKHETIPGYMRAMTMLFKVDPSIVGSVKKGDAITATLVEREDGFHLEDIKPAN